MKCQQRQANIWMKYWTTLKQQMAEQKAPDCFVKQFIETDYEKQDISEIQAAFVAGCMLLSLSFSAFPHLMRTI